MALSFTARLTAGPIKAGRAVVDITPQLPVALDGQMHLRVADSIESPIEANILVLESQPSALAVFVSCDLVTIPTELRDLIRERVGELLPGFDVEKIIVNATHTHTSAVVRDGWYQIPGHVTQVRDYWRFLSTRVAAAIAEAWKSRQPCSMSWGIGQAKVAYNRRAVYADGTAQMYGKTDVPDFRGIEGYEDQDINTLFFWSREGQLIATCINVASPAQIVEGRSDVNADYWHWVRVFLREKFGGELSVLGWIGAAGDQTPRPMYGQAAAARMLELQGASRTDTRGDAYLVSIGRKIANSVLETYETVKTDRYGQPLFYHETDTLYLPMRLVTEEEYHYARRMRDEDLADPERSVKYHRRIAWHQEVLDRFERQRNDPRPEYEMELSVLRIGNVAICTNSFELFTDYGIQIKARSKALQTFIIQLVGPGTYLPTERAVKGGSYSAIVQSNRVGPEGGQILVEETLKKITGLWKN